MPTGNSTYTIAEIARLTGLPASTLRYYESIHIIDPIARDKHSKQRVYSEDDLTAVTAIACLGATGMSIDDMRSYLANRVKGVAAAPEQIALLEQRKHQLAAEAAQLQIRQAYVELKIHYWQAVLSGDEAMVASIAARANDLAKQLKK